MPANGSSPESKPSIFPGATISGRFRLERVLGRGSMGSVWLARHLMLDVDVAVKFIDAALRDQKDHRSRFALEAQAAARINSPHVVNVLDFGAESSGRLYIAMEYLQGEDLNKLLERNGRLSPELTARVVSHTCRGLSRAHALGIAHRDVKPENLFLCGAPEDDGFVLKILDFGVAKTAPSAQAASKDFTGTVAGQLVGSPAYMSPEQAHGSLNVDFRSDLFSIAVVAYHCLTGVVPFGGDSLAELLIGIVSKDPVPATRLAPGLPRAIDDWFQRALDKDPARRFASAKELAQAFHMAVGQHASSVTDYTSGSQPAVSRTMTVSRPVTGRDTVLHVDPSLARLPRSHTPNVSNHTASPGVPLALGQVAEIANVLGIALVGPEGDPVAHHSLMGLPSTTFSDVMTKVRDSLEPFESLETSPRQALALYFESATVLLRWIESHAVIVIGTEQVHPTVLAVSLNAAASKLQHLAKAAGGAAVAFRSTISSLSDSDFAEVSSSGITARPSPTDLVSDGVIGRLTNLFAKPLGAVGRLAIQQRLKSGKPTIADYPAFVRRMATLLEDGTEREAFINDALLLVAPLPSAKPASMPAAPPATQRIAPPPAPQVPVPPVASGASDASDATRAPLPAPPRPSAPSHPEITITEPNTKPKKFVMYRGRKIEVDE